MHDSTTVSALYYADAVCIWASGDSIRALQLQLESAVDRMNESLVEVALYIAAGKSRLMLSAGQDGVLNRCISVWIAYRFKEHGNNVYLG